jgi:hypothetical protein
VITRFIAISTAVVALCFLVGCSKSSTTQASFESSSKFSSSPFKSSSKSSSGSDETEDAYQRDVRDYTAKLAASEMDLRSYQRDLSAIAEAYGISDWERRDATFVAIGRGLAKAQISDRRFSELAVELANRDYARLALVKSGYETYRTP